MTFTYFPFDAGPGSQITENQWRKMAMFWLQTGILRLELNEFEVVQHTPSAAMIVDVKTGKAWIRGHYVESDATEPLVIAANSSGDDRIDRVVMRAEFQQNTILPVVVQGTPSGSPAAPALTQTSARWEIPLAQVAVADGATSIVTADITDEREYSSRFDYTEVWGRLESDGTIALGAQFSSGHPGTGTYNVNFEPVLVSAPVVVVTAKDSGGARIAQLNGDPTTTSFQVKIRDDTGSLVDCAFHFIARTARS